MKLISTILCTLALSVGLYAAPPRNSGHANERQRPRGDHQTDRNAGREQRNRDRNAARDHQSDNKRYDKGRRNAERHWNGHRFDQRFFVRNFGMYHPFFFGGPEFYWYGNPCLLGSTFEYGGVYFGFDYPCSAMWVGYPWDGVYIDEGPEGYVLVNPAYPGVVFSVRVMF